LFQQFTIAVKNINGRTVVVQSTYAFNIPIIVESVTVWREVFRNA
jgi:hypothetical protein